MTERLIFNADGSGSWESTIVTESTSCFSFKRKLRSGNVIKVAEIVRDLWRRDRERGLSAGEKRMLARARQILVSELALAEKVTDEKAEVLLDEVLAS